MLVVAHLAVVVLAASSVLAGAPDLPVSPPTSSVGVVSPPVTPTTMIGNSASTPIPSPPAPPIGMRRMYPPVPPSLPSASPPVPLPEPVQELTNSERLARGLPIRPPRLLRVRPGSEGLDKGALLHGGMVRLPRPSKLPKIPKKRQVPSVPPHVALPLPTPPGPVPRSNGPAAPVIGSTDGIVRYCAVSGACQVPKGEE